MLQSSDRLLISISFIWYATIIALIYFALFSLLMFFSYFSINDESRNIGVEIHVHSDDQENDGEEPEEKKPILQTSER